MIPKFFSIPKQPMKLDFGQTALKINVSFAAAVTLMLILDSSGICAVALLCCVIHEAGHIICLLALGEKPKKIELSFYGIKLERAQLPSIKSADEIAVYASGPVMNFVLSALLFIASNGMPNLKTAGVISLCVGMFNLVPCRPLDGGNILFAALCLMTDEERAEKACGLVSFCTIIPLGIAGIFLAFGKGNFTLLAVAVYLGVCIFASKKKL